MRFRFREKKIRALMDASRAIQQKAIDFAGESKKTATFTI
jgi:hypothetical protein